MAVRSRSAAVARISAPSEAELQAMYAASAEALLANRPLRATSSPALAARHAMTAGELAALDAVGLSTAGWAAERSQDQLAHSVVDYIALIETSFDTAAVARMLGVDVSRIRQRIRERSLFGIEYEGEWHLPKFQFERRKVLPGLARVLEVLPADGNPLEVAAWFLSPNIDLVVDDDAELPISPRAWLLRGAPPDQVVALAREL